MGCCSSTDRGGDDASQPNRHLQPSDSNSHETQERGRTGGAAAAAAVSNEPSPSPAASRSANAPNRPLILPPPSAQIALPLAYSQTSRRLTPTLLEREREAFFDTRVSGRREIWAALKIICSLLEVGDAVQAQAILDAVECTCPTGEVWEPEGPKARGRARGRGGIYDQLGERYAVPAWIIGVPEGTSSADALAGDADATVAGATADGASLRRDDEHDGISDREKGSSVGSLRLESGEESEQLALTEKGKGRAVDSQPLLPASTTTATDTSAPEREPLIKVRARLSHNAQDVIVKFSAGDSVAVVMDKIKERGQLKPDASLRIFYLGRVLKASETLEAQGWTVGHILNVYVFDPA